MHKFIEDLCPVEDLCPEDRRVYRRWIGGLVGLYGVLMAVMTGMVVGQQLSNSREHASAVAEAVSGGPLGAVEDWMQVKRAAKSD